MTDTKFILDPINELIGDLELYVSQLKALKEKIKMDEIDEDVIADYEEALQIQGIWDNLGEIPL